MSGFTCPVCESDLPDPADYADDPAMAKTVAFAMGVPYDAFASIRNHQKVQQIERELHQHFATHEPEDWVPPMMALALRNKLLEAAVEMCRASHPTPDPSVRPDEEAS